MFHSGERALRNRSRYEELLLIVKSYISIYGKWANQSCIYDSGTGLLQYRSRPGRYGVFQGKGKLGGSHAVLYDSTWSPRCEVHGVSAKATI